MTDEIIRANGAQISFLQLALALADDYESIYVIDMNDDSYVEYSTAGKKKEMTIRSSGGDFFADVPKNTRKLVLPEDREKFLAAFEKENVLRVAREGYSFTLDYRLVIDGEPRYYSLKTIRSGEQSVVIGVQNVDVQRRRELARQVETKTYAEIAQSFASLYEVIYHIDVKTGRYTVYSSSESFSRLGIESGENFFVKMRADVIKYLHKDDCYTVMRALERDALLKALDETGVFSIIYRQMLDDKSQYVNLIAIKSKLDSNSIVIGVGNIDKQVRKEKAIQAENRTFGEIAMALAQRYEVIYHVNIESGEYLEYSADEKYSKLNIGTKGADFFGDTQKNMKRDIYPEDYPMMALAMKKENLLEKLKETGKTFINYRLMLDGRAQFVTLFAVRPKEDSEHIIVAVANIDTAKRNDLDVNDALGSAMDMANRDGLTGVKNKRSYEQMETAVDELIKGGEAVPFAVAVCDINGLKQVNDTQGHQAGDEYIKSACTLICNTFKHSPVFRIGGDEFAVILKGSDYDDREALLRHFDDEQDRHIRSGQVTVAVGIAEYAKGSDSRLRDVFERADEAMYENKKQFKTMHSS